MAEGKKKEGEWPASGGDCYQLLIRIDRYSEAFVTWLGRIWGVVVDTGLELRKGLG